MSNFQRAIIFLPHQSTKCIYIKLKIGIVSGEVTLGINMFDSSANNSNILNSILVLITSFIKNNNNKIDKCSP